MALTLVQLADAIGEYAKRGRFSDHDAAALARNLSLFRGRVVAAEDLARKLLEPVLAPVDPAWFKSQDPSDAYYIIGGSPGNPNGVSFSPTSARAWWDYVFAHRLDVSGVRPTLLPGSFVLTKDGVEVAEALSITGNLNEKAAEDFNPLGLPVIP